MGINPLVLLTEAEAGAPGAKEKLFSALYVELHRLAQRHLQRSLGPPRQIDEFQELDGLGGERPQGVRAGHDQRVLVWNGSRWPARSRCWSCRHGSTR